MTVKRLILALVALALLAGGAVAWKAYRDTRAGYDAYRTLIQPGIRVAGVPVGWLSPEKARAAVEEQVAEPYYRDFTLLYNDEPLKLSPVEDLNLHIPVDEMVSEAVSASHQYDYWDGFKLWIQGEAMQSDLDVPFRMTFDESATARFLTDVAGAYDVAPVQPMVDIQALAFIPGRPGRSLDLDAAEALVNERARSPRSQGVQGVSEPDQRQILLPVSTLEPDQSPARIASMLSTLGPVMERPPVAPSFYTATIPLSMTIGLDDTETGTVVTHTGEMTWTFPHFASYTGPLTSTHGFFFEPGQPGFTFNMERAMDRVEGALRSQARGPISFEPDMVPPPPSTPALLIPPLEARLSQFPGTTSILVKDLDSGELIYDSHSDYVLSGMSVVKIGIMVEVYRYFKGVVDEQTHQELLDMLGSESCNPCANRLMAIVGGGSADAGAQRATGSMRQLGLPNFYLCAPFRVVELWEGEGTIVWTANTGLMQAETPRYDRCVKTTPREMANLLEMIYECTEDQGSLRDIFPDISPEACQEMIDIMAANDLRNMLGAGIPSEVKLAHKHGFSGYDVPWGDTRAEVGIVFSPGATWLVSFYIWEDTPWIDWGINQPLYRDVSNMLYNYFNPEEPYWPLPPWAPEPEGDTG